MSQLNTILKDVQALLVGNASGVNVYRENYVPTELGSLRDTGYIVWDLEIEGYEQNNCEYTGVTFSTLTVYCYAVSRATRDTIFNDVMNLFMPLNGQYRKSIAPRLLDTPGGSAFCNYCNIMITEEITLMKEGHQSPETPGIYVSFDLKLSVLGE